ncbi:hypothetical protein ACFL59_12740 [Planctomycetota bacterium]
MSSRQSTTVCVLLLCAATMLLAQEPPPDGKEDQGAVNLSRTSFALTAAGVAALCAVGESQSSEAQAGFRFLEDLDNRPPASRMTRSFTYFYAHFYAVRAFATISTEWLGWHTRVAEKIVAGQRSDGSWEDLVGRNCAAAMATLVLQTRAKVRPKRN